MSAVRVLVACVALVLALVAPAGAASDVRATLRASSTMPVAETPWRYVITVKDRQGRALPARARLQILLGSTVVGCWKGRAMAACEGPTAGTWIAFKGKRTGTITWPAQSVGVTLTFRAVVVTAGRSLRLRVPVRVQAP
jgi:hypothetical protein